MVQFGYLGAGLCGLAHAHPAGPMAGHLGAAVVAGYLFGEDQHDLDPGVHAGVEKELDRIVRGEEAFWFDPKKAGITIAELFEPLPQEPTDSATILSIPNALSGNIGSLRQSGHNVIFTAIAVRALSDHPEFATAPIVDGIQRLIASFNGQVSGRGYYGKQRGWIGGDKVQLPETDDFPPYADLQQMADVVVDELIRTASVRRQGFGGLFHVINHAAGLIELAQYGYQDLARQGLAAHWQHIRLWRSLPDVEDELGPVEPAAFDPRTPEYWTTGTLKRDSAMLTHRIKTLYGFFTVLRLVDDAEKRERAEEQFLYLMP